MKNQTSFTKGHIVTEDMRKKISKSHKGNPSNMLGKHHTKEAIELNRQKHLGKKHSEITKIKMSIVQTKRMSNPEEIKKSLGHQGKSTLEIKFEDIVNKLGLPYKFVGNGEIIIARKCPDFINSKGKKIAIEVFYRKHKELFRNGLEEWKAERARIFTENGWKIIFFDETQVNEQAVKTVLSGE